ncbi:GEVED domain-containing protein, partial [Streptococcus mitis]
MKGKQQQDFRVEKYIRYGIRKYSFGAASVAIAAGLMFLGNGAVSATEVQGAETSVAAATAPANQADSNKEKEAVKPETKVEEAKPEVKAEEAKKVNKAVLEASIATLESKLSTAKYADATVVSSAKEVLAAAKATLAKADASQADVDAQAETVSALSTVVTESNTAGFDKKKAAEKEVAKAEAEKKATPAEKTLSEAKSALDKASSEADVTNRLAKSELSKKEVKEENKAAVEAAVAKNQAVLSETKALLAEKSVTKEQVDAQLERLNESILAVYNELKNAGIGRDGKFAVNLEDAQTTALKDATAETGAKWLEQNGYKSLAEAPKYIKGNADDDKAIKNLNNQIQWLDFGDDTAWTNRKANKQLQVGSVYEKELMSGYIVKMTVKELKPFHATEIYKNRVAGTSHEASYKPNEENIFNQVTKNPFSTGISGNQQTGYTHVKNAGLDTGSAKTTIAGTDDSGTGRDGQIVGVKFAIEATYNGKPVKPGIVMTSGEDIGSLETEIYTTNGTPWELAGVVGSTNGHTDMYKPHPNFNRLNEWGGNLNKWTTEELRNAIDGKMFATKDAATAGLGSQVFGGYTNGDSATPVVSTSNVTEVGFYIMSSGQQSSMIGIKFSDFGDLPESYGTAEHYLRTQAKDYITGQINQIQQPYLGTVKADIDSVSGTRVRGVDSDDTKEQGDEGVAQLIAPEDVHINKDNGEPEVKLVQAADNTYRVKVIASANGNDNYDGTVGPAYVRGFIDFNGNGKFDEGEASEVVTVNGNQQTVELVFKNTQVIDTTKDAVNFRTRIATDRKQIEKPVGIAFSGEVEDNQIQVSIPPRGDKEETTGKQGETQSVGIEFVSRAQGDDASDLGSNNGKTTFNSYGKRDYSEQGNSISLETTKKKQAEGVMIVDPSGNLVKSYTKAGQGTYTVTDDKVIFTPEASFVGKADGIVLRAVDANGHSTGWTALTDQHGVENINDGTHTTGTKTMDAVYIPTVTPKEITADPETSTDVQGKEQKKTPTFTAGAGTENPTPVTPSAQYPAKLVDPKTGDKVDSVTVEGEGTYTINPTTGEVTFQPLPTFTGTASGVGVSLTAPVGQDKDGNPVTATATTTYTPTVTAVTPTADPATSTGVQGETQKGTPTFTEGNSEVPIKEGSVKLLNPDGTEATGPVDALDPNGNKVGTYTVDPTTGEVTFTPTDKSYVGPVQPANVQAEDKNGTKVKTTYTPTIVGVTPTADPAKSVDIQGATQENTVSFEPGKTTIAGEEKTVEIDPSTYTLLGEDGQPATEVPAKDPEGNVIGKYTLKTVDGKAVAVFEPTDKTYSGEVQPVRIQAKDKNGTAVETTYTPLITPVVPTAEPAETTDIQGKEQTGKPEFTPGNPNVPMDDDTPATFEDGSKEKVVPGEGTYTVAPDGTVTFTPEKGFTGKGTGVTVKRVDKNGTPVTAKYTPNVTPVTPTADPAETTDIQGKEQTGKPTFKPGNPDVPMDDDTPATFEDGSKEKVVPGEGTYTVAPDGTVTFTPEKGFTGKGTGVTVKRVDK